MWIVYALLAALAGATLMILTKVGLKNVDHSLALLGVFVGFAAPAVQPANLTPVTGTGFAGVLAGAAIFLWSWDGFMRMAIMASEVKEPRRSIPFAVVGGIVFAAVVFLVVPAAA